MEDRDRVGAATSERDDVIFLIAGTGTAGLPGRGTRMLPLELTCYRTGSVLARRSHAQASHQRDHARHCGKHPPVHLPSHRVAMKTMANSEAIAVRLQKICMAQRQCRQNSSSHPMTIAALPTIT